MQFGRHRRISDASITVTALVDAGLSGTITNTATVTTTSEDAESQNNAVSASVVVLPNPDLSLIKFASGTSVRSVGLLTYTLTITNLGPSTSTESTVTDVLPSGLALTANTTVGATCVGESIATCLVGCLAAGPQALVTLTTQVANADLGTIINTATIRTSTPQDPNTSNNTGTATTTVLTSNLMVSRTASVGALSAGERLFHTITVSNIRTTTATNVTLSDALPSGFILLSATSTQGPCGNSVSCALGEIGVRVSVAVTIQGAVLLDFSGNLINAAAVSSPSFDKSIGNNQATVTVDVSPAPADLNVSKIAPERPVLAGSDIEYTIKVANNDPATSTGTFVTDDLPHSVSVISAIPTQGSW